MVGSGDLDELGGGGVGGEREQREGEGWEEREGGEAKGRVAPSLPACCNGLK